MPGNYGNSYKSIRVRRGLLANIPALRDGEPGYCTDTQQLAIGFAGINYFFNLGTGGGSAWSGYGSVATPEVIAPSVGLSTFSTTDSRQAHLVKGIAAGGGVNCTATPSIPLGNLFGKEVRLVGMHATDYPIFQDGAALVGSGMNLNGPMALKLGASLTVMCLGVGQNWQEVGRVEA